MNITPTNVTFVGGRERGCTVEPPKVLPEPNSEHSAFNFLKEKGSRNPLERRPETRKWSEAFE